MTNTQHWTVYTHALSPEGGPDRWLIGATRWDGQQGPLAESYKVMAAVTGTEAEAKAVAADMQRRYDHLRGAMLANW